MKRFKESFESSCGCNVDTRGWNIESKFSPSSKCSRVTIKSIPEIFNAICRNLVILCWMQLNCFNTAKLQTYLQFLPPRNIEWFESSKKAEGKGNKTYWHNAKTISACAWFLGASADVKTTTTYTKNAKRVHDKTRFNFNLKKLFIKSKKWLRIKRFGTIPI